MGAGLIAISKAFWVFFFSMVFLYAGLPGCFLKVSADMSGPKACLTWLSCSEMLFFGLTIYTGLQVTTGLKSGCTHCIHATFICACLCLVGRHRHWWSQPEEAGPGYFEFFPSPVVKAEVVSPI